MALGGSQQIIPDPPPLHLPVKPVVIFRSADQEIGVRVVAWVEINVMDYLITPELPAQHLLCYKPVLHDLSGRATQISNQNVTTRRHCAERRQHPSPAPLLLFASGFYRPHLPGFTFGRGYRRNA